MTDRHTTTTPGGEATGTQPDTGMKNIARTEPVCVALGAAPVLLAQCRGELFPGDANVAGERDERGLEVVDVGADELVYDGERSDEVDCGDLAMALMLSRSRCQEKSSVSAMVTLRSLP